MWRGPHQGKKQVEAAVHNGKKVFHTTYKGEHTHDAPQVLISFTCPYHLTSHLFTERRTAQVTRLNVDDQNSFKNLVMNESLWVRPA